ncbi:MAG: DUF4301 family protein [Bacteroidales bacterium]|nr:DUF4301 family protein [Bacteroidales bacterium]MCF8388437.1 DUF4301 family protein [Bacteroidales bacterium]MCF8399185.1 DUF4301 family protein [Bacteroidales bacterium]
MFESKDRLQIQEKGISMETIEQQLENFRQGFPFVQLVDPATPGNGVLVFEEDEVDHYRKVFEQNFRKNDIKKFIPASGAATRMFKHLHEFHQQYEPGKPSDEIFADRGFNSVYNFFEGIRHFAFYDRLKEIMKVAGEDLEQCLADRKYGIIIDYLLEEEGLNYASLPKGLILFHQYDDGPRMSIEEHLVESAEYCVNENEIVPIHFTVSPEHMDKFKDEIRRVKPKYEEKLAVRFDVSYSIQKPSTDTIAVDLDNEPFRENDGKLLFRPGGHGALIENLNELENEVIFIKNIDNIVPDRLREPTYLYKKVIGGYLLYLRKKVFEYLEMLGNRNISSEEIDEIADFATNELNADIVKDFNEYSREEKREFLFSRMNRPIRVCGMVRNEGEPGGGPFWTRNQKGEVTLQIVEKSQIDMKDPDQKAKLNKASHFNPVDIVCSIRNYRGEKFDLKDYVDPSTGFISIKSKNGRDLKAQELPGLWNGAMANWITIFVETPIITFNPVKTINDLLRETHQ